MRPARAGVGLALVMDSLLHYVVVHGQERSLQLASVAGHEFTVTAYNLVGDGLRDALDPHLRGAVLLRPEGAVADGSR